MIEPDRELDDEKLKHANKLFDEYLNEANSAEYKRRRQQNWIGEPLILVQKKGTHDEWRRYRQKLGFSSAQIKPIRLLDNEEKINFFMNRLKNDA